MTEDYSISIAQSFADIDPESWKRLSGTSRDASGKSYNPFISHEFLSSMEDSGSATAKTGWLRHHLLLENAAGSLIGAVPAYLKNHSKGEYVFDHGWADAFERAGGHYYPKLQCSVPFTPATGPRLLVANGEDVGRFKPLLASGLAQVAEKIGVSSAHVTFLQEDDLSALLPGDFLHRTDQQSHFINDGYRDHNDFLDALSSRKRKGLKLSLIHI